ncbi:MAG TPA: hypothetical protein VGO70_00250 [Arsenicitalea sp.]|nr:hypothetical protein [Arsenicitalea sp.]
MIKTTFICLAAIAMVAIGSNVADAKSVKSHVTTGQVTNDCASTLANAAPGQPNGQSAKGSIGCDAKGVSASAQASGSTADDNGTESGSDAAENGAED